MPVTRMPLSEVWVRPTFFWGLLDVSSRHNLFDSSCLDLLHYVPVSALSSGSDSGVCCGVGIRADLGWNCPWFSGLSHNSSVRLRQSQLRSIQLHNIGKLIHLLIPNIHLIWLIILCTRNVSQKINSNLNLDLREFSIIAIVRLYLIGSSVQASLLVFLTLNCIKKCIFYRFQRSYLLSLIVKSIKEEKSK